MSGLTLIALILVYIIVVVERALNKLPRIIYILEALNRELSTISALILEESLKKKN